MDDVTLPGRGSAGAKGKQAQKRKLMVYGAVGAALLVVLLLHRGSSSQTAAPADSGQLTPVASPAIDSGSSGGAFSDPSGQLADFESQLLGAIPAAISAGIAATPMPAGSTGDPAVAGPSPVTINVGSGTGQQVGGSTASPSSSAPTAKSTPHPSLTSRVSGAVHAAHQMPASQTVDTRSAIQKLAAKHPGWGPHTLAHGSQLKGHSSRF